MTVLLVLFTLILFLTVDHFVQKKRTVPAAVRDAAGARTELTDRFQIRIPEDVSLATNHVWMRSNQDGTVTIGLDEVLSRVVGAAQTISIPREGDPVLPVATAIAVGVHDRSLRLASPASGHVVESNQEVLKNPSLILNDPYGEGWLMRVKSGNGDLAASKKYIVHSPIEWLREQAALVRDFIVTNAQVGQPAMLQEGGLPTEGVLQQLHKDVWNKFGRTFVTLRPFGNGEGKEGQK